MSNEIKFGDVIETHHKLVHCRSGDRRYWDIVNIVPIKVIVIGKRNLSNGVVVGDEFGHLVYEPRLYVKTWLVVANDRSKPFYMVKHNGEIKMKNISKKLGLIAFMLTQSWFFYYLSNSTDTLGLIGLTCSLFMSIICVALLLDKDIWDESYGEK